ncbi:hypothetical protein DPMN_129488 [Dreissena polymorpha]|uniref:Uncharacterized protein n=1 Tax=Dreissena polymorpha TaxID=45954 RepID=A0A9D4H960_DREPO|nr:hypothetical protein DPMN_129488 [Dreissena polymorpha]
MTSNATVFIYSSQQAIEWLESHMAMSGSSFRSAGQPSESGKHRHTTETQT